MTGRAFVPLLAVAAAVPAGGAAAQRIAVDLPAGTLGDSTDRLARQAGLSIVLGDPGLPARRVPRVKGTMTAEAAVRLLARHADADAWRIGTANWRLTARIPTKRPAKRPRPPPPPAVEVDDGASGDIVVQASKRGISTASFAGSVEVIEAPRVGIEGGTAALVTRSTIISSTYRGSGREKLFIRGLSDSSFSGRLQSVTGLYFGDVRLTYSAADPDLQLYDIASVEVLQGPQGTLYGSGSLGGLIRFNPRLPERGVAGGAAGSGVSATAHGGMGADADAMVNVPLTGNLSVRAIGYARSEGGFIDRPAIGDDVNRTRIDGGRAIVRWWPGDGWTADAVAIAQRSRTRDAQYATIGAPPLTNLGTEAEPFGSDYRAAHLVVNGRLGGLTLTSATGVAGQRFREILGGLFNSNFDVHRRNDMVTHETRLFRSAAGGAGWVAGLSYTNSRGEADSVSVIRRGNAADPIVFGQSIGNVLTEFAVFGEATVRIAPFLSVGAGARWVQVRTTIRQEGSIISGPSDMRSRFKEQWLLPTASLLLTPMRRLSAYVRYQQGHRPDAVRVLSPEGVAAAEPGRERISAVDSGVRWAGDGGLEAAVSVEHSRWRALQLDFFEGFIAAGGNFGDWTVFSANASARWPATEHLVLSVAASFNRSRSRYSEHFAADWRLPEVADIVSRGGIEWTHAIGRSAMLRLEGWGRYEGGSSSFLFAPANGQGDYFRTGLTADVTRDADRLTLSVENLLDAQGTRSLTGSATRFGTTVTPLRPRTIRIGYRRTF